MTERDETSESLIAAVVAGEAQMQDLNAVEREIAHSRIDDRIHARAKAASFGDELVAEGQPIVFMDSARQIVHTPRAGE